VNKPVTLLKVIFCGKLFVKPPDKLFEDQLAGIHEDEEPPADVIISGDGVYTIEASCFICELRLAISLEVNPFPPLYC